MKSLSYMTSSAEWSFLVEVSKEARRQNMRCERNEEKRRIDNKRRPRRLLYIPGASKASRCALARLFPKPQRKFVGPSGRHVEGNLISFLLPQFLFFLSLLLHSFLLPPPNFPPHLPISSAEITKSSPNPPWFSAALARFRLACS